MQKPSTLWPPPSDDMTNSVHASLRSRIRQTFGIEERTHDPVATILSEQHMSSPISPTRPVNVGTMTPAPALDHETITLTAESGEVLKVDQQVHMYTTNSLLIHPLVSPALSYLGGLPPLLFIASDKEVLRDEIIYTSVKDIRSCE